MFGLNELHGIPTGGQQQYSRRHFVRRCVQLSAVRDSGEIGAMQYGHHTSQVVSTYK